MSNQMQKVGEQKKSLAMMAGDVPEFMRTEPREGLETIGKYQSTPRLGIVQGSSLPERKAEHGEGGVAIFPDGLHVAGQGEEFVVIPLIFWPTWEKWSDINDQSQPMVLETTQDETSELARKAKNRLARVEKYNVNGNDYKYKYVESLNFIAMIDSGPAKGELVTLSFHIGEHRVGMTLNGNIKRRQCSIFGNRFSLKTAIRTRNNRSWYGFEINNPGDTEGGYVRDAAKYKQLAEVHRELKSMIDSGKYTVVRDDEETGGGDDGGEGGGEGLPV